MHLARQGEMNAEAPRIRMRDELDAGPLAADAGHLEAAEIIAHTKGDDDALAALPARLLDQLARQDEAEAPAVQPPANLAHMEAGIGAARFAVPSGYDRQEGHGVLHRGW